ncbi:bacillopeptidase F precursor [bacterium BMS3Bbin03]|nr:bacillopeptidase F precursor [bacterium BMS3Bbin03]
MKKRFVFCLAFVLICFQAGVLWAQQITLTSVPYKLIGESESVTVTWLEPVSATLHYGKTHGQYDLSLSQSGNRSLTFVPQNDGIQPGVYYAIITNGALSSQEFPLIIEASVSPKMRQPQNSTTISTATPEFQWDEVAGVPYYHLILSDREVVISRDADGNLQLTGANIIWQVITQNTHITYGDPDPSGYFTEINGMPSPLLNGNQYTWIVLNNYGNNPALSSLIQSGVSTFQVQLTVPVGKPVLVSPANLANLSAETITFQWQSVSNAVNYLIQLFELVQQDNSSSSILVWSTTTSNLSIDFPARAVLKGTQYSWRVLAMDNAGNGAASATRDFIYQVPVSALNIHTRDLKGQVLPWTNISVAPLNGSSSNVSYVTTDYGNMTISVQPGSYKITASKEGFLDTTKTISAPGGDTVSVAIYLSPAIYKVTGIVKDQLGRFLPNVTVHARENTSGRIFKTISDAGGGFLLTLSAGLWDVWGEKENYSDSDTTRVEITSQTNVSLSQPLILKEFKSTLTGKVVNPSGLAILSGKVLASKGNVEVYQYSASNGTFSLQVSSGTWTVTVLKDGYVSPAPRTVNVTAGQTVQISPDFVLQPDAGILSGFVFDGQKALGNALVQATPPSGLPVSTPTDPGGVYALNLASGNYTVTVSKQGYASPDPAQIAISTGQTLSNVNFTLHPNPVSISGRVTSGGNPVEGVIVRAGGALDTTRANGTYVLWVPPGTFQVTAAKAGFAANQIRTVTIGLGENKANIDFTLTPNSGIIKGTVQEGTNPIAEAVVLAVSGSDTLRTLSAALGGYRVSVKPGTWKMTAQKAGFVTQQGAATISVQSGQTVSGIDFNLIRNIGTVSGQVKDNHNNPLPGAAVQVENARLQALTDNSGFFAIQLEPGAYQLTAQKTGYDTQTKPANVTLNAVTSLNYSLTTMGTLTGKIADNQTRLPIDKASIFAVNNKDTTRTETDYTGEYSLHLNGGTYQIVADQLGYHALDFSVSIAAGVTRTQDIFLLPAPGEIARLQGKIVDDSNLPINGVPITLSGGKVALIYTEMNGTFDIKRLQAGLNYSLRPHLRNYFFVPEKRSYAPLTQNKVNQNFLGALYGDVSGNKAVSSFDGSLILRISAQQNVAPYYQNQPRDSIAADVSGNGQVSSFDASLIFRYAVQLIDRFPAEPSRLGKMRQIYADPTAHIFTFRILSHKKNRWTVAVSGDNFNRLLATQWEISYAPDWIDIRNCALLPEFQNHRLAWSKANGLLTIATAGAEAPRKSGDFLKIVLRVKGDASVSPLHFLKVVHVSINEGLVAARFISPEETAEPTEFHLYQNFPNPFNSETLIRLALPETQSSEKQVVELTLYNVLGQEIKTLVRKKLASGYYQFKWNGTDQEGRPVAGGIYFYRLKAGKFVKIKKLLYLK